MRRVLYIILGVVLVGVAFWMGWYFASQTNKATDQPTAQTPTTQQETPDTTETKKMTTEHTSKNGVTLIVTEPIGNAVATTPLTVKGSVPGNWSNEGSFPVKILDADRSLVAQASAQLEGDWMTEAMVPFTASIPFTTPTTPTGYLVLEKDNASGLEENADSVEIPIRFSE